MSRKITNIDLDDLRKRYFSYQRFSQMANELGVSINSIIRRIKKMGLPTGTIGERIPKEEMVTLYKSGMSQKALARRYNCEKIVIQTLLKKFGVEIRDNATANRLMMSKRTREENIKNTLAAHMAVKGKPKTEEFLRKKALGIERVGGFRSRGEEILAKKLIEKGLEITPQKAIGCYNIDIAIPEFCIAVEVFGGQWHSIGSHAARFRKRFDFLINSGWLPIIVWDKRSTKEDFVGAAEYIFSIVEKMRRGEPLICQEHVIGGNGAPCACGKSNIEYRAAVGGDKCGDIIRGKDGRFTHDTVGVGR